MMDLTRQERQVIIFIFAVSLAGLGLDLLARRVPPLERRRCLDNLGKVDLNTADKETLKALPGVGEKMAGRIIEYREENNGFTCLDELSEVKGMRRNLLARLRECLFVR